MIQEQTTSMQLEKGLPTRQIVRRKEEIVGASEENENVPGEGGAFPVTLLVLGSTSPFVPSLP
jgi:hypothetical protein